MNNQLIYNFFKNIWSSFIHYTKYHSVIVGAVMSVIFCVYLYSRVESWGINTNKNFGKRDEVYSTKDTTFNKDKTIYIYDSTTKSGIIVNPKKFENIYSFSRTYSQLKTVKYRMQAHSKAIQYFLINLYYFIVIQTLFSILVLVLGLIISKKGWGDSSPKLLATFLTSACFLLFFQLLPKAMKFEENLSSNRERFMIYTSIENNILTYLSTDEVNDKFVTEIDAELKTYHSVSFDLQQIPFSEVRKQFEEIRKASESTNDNDADVVNVTKTYIHDTVYKPSNRYFETIKVEEIEEKSTEGDIPEPVVEDTIIK